MKKKVIAFSPADVNNMKYFEMMKNSLRKFHSEEELPLMLIGPEYIKRTFDSMIFYRMAPLIAKDLIKEYDLVIKLDADQIITAPLTHIIEDKNYDVACVQNWSPKEPSYQVWDIPPQDYVNCGLVAMRSEEFVEHWWSLCQSGHFEKYQFKEQDLLNIMIEYGNYKVKFLDKGSDGLHGLASKGYWQYIKLSDKNELILPANSEDGYPKSDEKIVVIHWAGGNEPGKMNFRIKFQPDVVKRLEWLTK